MEKKDDERAYSNRTAMKAYRVAIKRWKVKEGIGSTTRIEIVQELRKSLAAIRRYHRKALKFKQYKRGMKK